MKSGSCITLLVLLFFAAEATAQQRKPDRVEIEADPIAFILNGYSFHLGYTLGHIRLDAGAFGIRQPGFALENKSFSVYSSGIGVKADYLLRQNRGLFAGIQSDFVTDKINLKNSHHTHYSKGFTLGFRTGYRFMFGKEHNAFKGLYLVPWVALIHAFKPAFVLENSNQYAQPRWSVFPTIHLGYRF